MARSDGFSGLSEFLAVARHASFRAAAAELGVTPAAVSQAIRVLEAKTGLVLFQRTTRRVGLTEAGEQLLARVRPAAAEIADAFEALTDLRDRPAGLLRLSVPRVAVPLVIETMLPNFRRAYPDVAVDIDVNDAAVDLTANNLDAGIRIGEQVERDMIGVRLTPDLRWSVLGAPAYFAAHGRPKTPEELTRHECIRYRFLTAGSIYRWEFVRGRREFSVEVRGGVTVNDGAHDDARAQRNGTHLYGRSVRGARSRGRATGIGAPRIPADEPGPVSILPRAHADSTEAARVHRHADGAKTPATASTTISWFCILISA
jgi:DNA-binding transcriptional LysR family regulator